MSRLVAYFSYSGVTAKKAEKIAEQQGAAIFEIRAQVPYTAGDVDWRNENSRNVLEYKDASCRPAIKELPDLTGVDEIWIGYPIWWYTHPRIINTFFEQADLAGKTVHLFATSGGSGIEKSCQELKEAYPAVHIAEAKKI